MGHLNIRLEQKDSLNRKSSKRSFCWYWLLIWSMLPNGCSKEFAFCSWICHWVTLGKWLDQSFLISPSVKCEILLQGNIKSDEYFKSTISFLGRNILPIDTLCAICQSGTEQEPYKQNSTEDKDRQWYLTTVNLSTHIFLYVCRERSDVKEAMTLHG